MRQSAFGLTLLLILSTVLYVPSVVAAPPGGTVEGDYALHMKNLEENGVASVTSRDLSLTLTPGKNYSFRVSAFVQSAQPRDFRPQFPLWLSFTGFSGPRGQIVIYFGPPLGHGTICFNLGCSDFIWGIGSWYQIELKVNDVGVEGYVNGTRISQFSAPLIGGSLETMTVSSTGIAEVYVDSIMVGVDGAVASSEGFEDGLSQLEVYTREGSTVDTIYFGAGKELRSTLASLTLGDRDYARLPLGSDLKISGRVKEATTLQGVSSVSVLVEFSNNIGNPPNVEEYEGPFQQIGTIITDNNGDFNLIWKPPNMGFFILRAYSSENCCFFGSSIALVFFEVDRALSRLSLTLESSANMPFKVGMEGTLTGLNSMPIPGANVVFSYTVPGASGWTTITSAKTEADGKYQASWTPQATGVFTVSASWGGDEIHQEASTTGTISSVLQDGTYVFSVSSDSTVSGLIYDPTTRKVRFTIDGPLSQNGYANITLPRALVSDISKVKVYVNGTVFGFQTSQSEDAVRLHILFTFQSSYLVEVSLGSAGDDIIQVLGSFLRQYLVYLVLVAGAVVSTIILSRKRWHRTGHTTLKAPSESP